MVQQEGVERRRDMRFRVYRPVRYRAFVQGRGSESPFQVGTMVDVSFRGLKMLTSGGVDVGSRVEVYAITDEGNLSVTGLVEVVRCLFRPHVRHNYNEFYNPEILAEYEVGLRSYGSRLFDRLEDIR